MDKRIIAKLSSLLLVLTLISSLFVSCAVPSSENVSDITDIISAVSDILPESSSSEPSSEPSFETSSEPYSSTEESEISAEPDVSEISDESEASDNSDFSVTPLDPPEVLEHGRTKFSDIKYSRPDFDKITSDAKSIEEKLKEGKLTDGEMLDCFNSLTELMIKAKTEHSVLSVHQSIDTSKTDIADELVLITELFAKAQQDYFSLADKLLDSKYEKAVFADYTEEEKQEIRYNANLIDSEYVEITKRIGELENLYIDNYSLEVMVGNKRMTLKEVEEQYGYGDYLYALNIATADIFLEMISLYKRISQKAGYSSYADYAYERVYCRDYTTADAAKLRDGIKEYFIPLYSRYSSRKSSFDTDGEYNVLIYGKQLRDYFNSISPTMAEAYDYMKEYGLFSVGYEDVRQAGAYTTYFDYYEEPFIFQHLDGNFGDLTTFVHEFGHFYCYYLYGSTTSDNLDIAEIHSQSNEFLFLPEIEKLFGKKAYEDIKTSTIASNLSSVMFAAVISEFEEKVFTSDFKSVNDLNKCFSELCKKYSLTWLPEYYWSLVHHVYLYPFYYISYATSLVPSLEIYAESCTDYASGVRKYNELMEGTGDAETFMTLLEETGFSSPFDKNTYKMIYDKLK